MGSICSAEARRGCAECQADPGLFSSLKVCEEASGGCGRSLCSSCLAHPLVTEKARGEGKVQDQDQRRAAQAAFRGATDVWLDIQSFCKACFQRLSLLDFTQDVDILGPSTGLTLLYVHGGGGCRKMFRQHAAAMVKNGFRCVLMDLPGHGSRMDEVLTMESAINAIVKVIKQHAPLYKGVKPVYVGGSLGGYIGMEFLGRHPDLCSCAIITMCGQNVGLGRGWAAGAGLWVMGTLLPKMGTRQIMSALVAQVRKNGHIPESLFMDDHLRTGMFFGQALAQVEILKETNPQAALGKFPGAMLFINGSQDHRDSEELWKATAQKGELIVYEGADHFFSHDDRYSQRFEDDCLDFIRRQSGNAI
ncbi:unnamed protein product [Durusdinium trenchii]|uniref:AB hydrolase-1 domain-containing protein n=1 Tax=Durusdinium trenchii TaxID=1381693 RepID=A0ABP0M3F2_9DINO